MNGADLQKERDRAWALDPFDSRRIAALGHLHEAERLYRSAHALIDKARRELQRSPDKEHGDSLPVGAMATPTADDMRAEIQVGGE